MKWIGQHIWNWASRFRNDVYLEDIATGTIASGGNLGLDSNNKIVKATDSAPDADASTKGIVELATTAETTTGTDTTRAVTPDGLKDGYQGSSNVTTLGTIGTGTWQGTVIASAYLDADTVHLTGTQTFTGRKTFTETVVSGGDRSVTPGDGAAIHVDASTITDNSTSASGTAAKFTHVNIERPTLAATNASVTTSDAATLYIQAHPAVGTNQTITRPWSLWVDAGNARFDGSIYSGTTEAIDSSGLVTVANQSNITGVGTISSGVWNGTAIGASYVATLNQDTTGNAATVTTAAGTSDENHVIPFTTTAAGSATLLSDTGILYNPSSNLLTVGDLSVSGTSTTIGTVTSGTWQGTAIASAYLDADTAHLSGTQTFTGAKTFNTAIATDSTKHLMHYEFRGYGTGDGTNYEIPVLLTDNQAPWEHNTSTGSDGLTAITVQTQIRTAGQVMPRACTLKKWTGWSTCGGSATAYIGLFKLTPVRNNNTDRSLVLLKETSYTALGNAKAEDFAETSFTDDSIAAGDILITGIKCGSGVVLYFSSTIEVEF